LYNHYGSGPDLTTKQRVLFVAPSCETGALWKWPDSWDLAHNFLFNDLEETVAAGVAGHLNGDYGLQHQRLARLLMNEMFNAGDTRVPWAEVVHRAALAHQEQSGDPHFGKGTVFLGAYTLTPPYASIVGVGEAEAGDAPSASPLFWASFHGGSWSTTLGFTVPERARVRVRVYDVRGRLVASPIDETYAAGTYREEWLLTDGLPSGVYLARLSAKGTTKEIEKTTKIVVVR